MRGGALDASCALDATEKSMRSDHQRALELLRAGVRQPDAEFREGQELAIRHIVEGRGRLLVVQRTGWGKSLVYFIATKLLRDAGAGPTLLISPLLSLMRNQIAAAKRMGVRAIRITSDNREHWRDEEKRLLRNKARTSCSFPRSGSATNASVLRCWQELPNASACWSSTKPIASRIGDTISGPTTAGSSGSPAIFRQTSAFSPPPRPQTIV